MDAQLLVDHVVSLGGFMLGAFFVTLKKFPLLNMLGLLQGLMAGFMLSISFGLARTAVDSMGFLIGKISIFVGAILFAYIAHLVSEPTERTEPTPGPTPEPTPDKKKKKKRKGDKKKIDNDCEIEDEKEFDLEAIVRKAAEFSTKLDRTVYRSGIITAIGVGLHHIVRGMAVFDGSIKGLRVGLYPALVTALYNIPEGAAIAFPVYFGTSSKWEVVKVVTYSSLAKPAGAILAYFFPICSNPKVVEFLLGSAGGVMAFLAFHEMLPFAFDCVGGKRAAQVLFLGMACMFLSSVFLLEMFPEQMSTFSTMEVFET